MTKNDIWDLEKYKITEKNKYSNIIDNNVYFDYWNRETAIRELFQETGNPEVKQVLRFAMELNNFYRNQAMNFYTAYHGIKDTLEGALKLTEQAIDHAYL